MVPTADQARSFVVTFDIEEDGSVLVTERISWEFPSGEDRRGIERLVTTSVGYQDRDDVYRRYAITDDIPIMLIDEAETVDEAEHERLLAKAEAQGITPTFAE